MMMRWVSLFFSFVHIVLILLIIYINVVFQDYNVLWSLNLMAFNMDRASILLLLTNSPIIKLRKVN